MLYVAGVRVKFPERNVKNTMWRLSARQWENRTPNKSVHVGARRNTIGHTYTHLRAPRRVGMEQVATKK
jgi:hypothetical protein